MAELLNLESTPAFHSCGYYFGGEGIHTVSGTAEHDIILFLVRGELGAGSTKVQAGRYYIFRAGDKTRLTGDDPEYFVIRFKGNYTPAEQTLPPSGRFDYKETVRHWNRLLELLDKQLDGQKVSKIEQQALFCQILSGVYALSSMPVGEYLAQIIMSDIAARYTEDITLEELSEKYFYSPNYIIRVFRKKYHVTPYRHIIHMRIDKAKQLLSSTDMTCQEIAEACGYHDMSTFHKAFVSRTGRSPDHWRKHMAEAPENNHWRGDYRSNAHAIRGGE